MTYSVSVSLTRRAWGGIIAAANEAGFSPEEFCKQLLQSDGIGYANLSKHRIGVLTAAELINRFTSQELASIKQVAAQNPQVNELVNRLVQRERVEQDDPALIEGLQQLASVGLLASDRPAELVAFQIPQPLPPTP